MLPAPKDRKDKVVGRTIRERGEIQLETECGNNIERKKCDTNGAVCRVSVGKYAEKR